jgi:hypothetical protein
MSANSLFQILEGLNIDGAVSIIHGSGAPSISATVGSVYLDNLNGVIYLYDATGSAGNPGWIQYASQSYVTQQIAQAVNVQLTWRPPVEVADTTDTTLPTGSASTPIVVDGISISNNQRVLFASLTTNPNVYIYDETTGTFTQDTAVVPGDTVYVINTGQQYTYSETSTSWVLSNLTTLDELNYIREFVGKSAAGSISPVYTSTNFVTGSPDLENAIALLDSEMGPNVKTSSYYIAPSGTINSNIQVLDTQLSSNTTSITNIVTGGGGSTVSASTAAAGTLTIDTAPSGTLAAKWLVYVSDTAGNLAAVEVLALNLGGGNVTFTTYGQLNSATVISGLVVNVSINGSSECVLTVTANDGFSVVAKRETLIS